MGFSIKSPAFETGGGIAPVYTCDDRDISPALTWTDPPAGTLSFALICDDPDAPGGTWVHWLIYGIPAAVRAIPENVPPVQQLEDGSCQGRNDFGRIGYGGPSPPRGPQHRYFFRLLALDTVPSLPPGSSRQQLETALSGHILDQTEVMGTYKR
jgi:Raf kinase inhibitor-like YbhB/YbcL family protein